MSLMDIEGANVELAEARVLDKQPLEGNFFPITSSPILSLSMGVIATGDTVIDQKVFDAAMDLRAKTYIEYNGILSEDYRGEDGIERDEDDERSIHFATFFNSPFKTEPSVLSLSLIHI